MINLVQCSNYVNKQRKSDETTVVHLDTNFKIYIDGNHISINLLNGQFKFTYEIMEEINKNIFRSISLFNNSGSIINISSTSYILNIFRVIYLYGDINLNCENINQKTDLYIVDGENKITNINENLSIIIMNRENKVEAKYFCCSKELIGCKYNYLAEYVNLFNLSKKIKDIYIKKQDKDKNSNSHRFIFDCLQHREISQSMNITQMDFQEIKCDRGVINFSYIKKIDKQLLSRIKYNCIGGQIIFFIGYRYGHQGIVTEIASSRKPIFDKLSQWCMKPELNIDEVDDQVKKWLDEQEVKIGKTPDYVTEYLNFKDKSKYEGIVEITFKND